MPRRRVMLIGAGVGILVLAGSATGFAMLASRHSQAARPAIHHQSAAATSTPGGPVDFGTVDTGSPSPLPSSSERATAPSQSSTPSGVAPHCVFSTGRAASTAAITPLAPSSAPPSALAVMVATEDRASQTVTLVGTDGRAVATASFISRTPLSCQDPEVPAPTIPIKLPFVSSSAGRVYFLDGDSDLRYLAPDGRTGLAAHLPGSSTAQAVFAVSPDDRRIAVTLFDFSSMPPHLHLFVQNLDGSHRVDLPNPSDTYVIPVGWHGGRLVLETLRSFFYAYSSYSPLLRPDTFVLMDPGTGLVIARYGLSACPPEASLPSAAGFICQGASTPTTVIAWTGITQSYNANLGSGGASLSPDGVHVAACCVFGALITIFTSTAAGGGNSTTSAEGYPADGGWLDNTHVVFRRKSSPFQSILDVTSGTTTGLPPGGIFVARLPAGF